jgi:hypothetical protein
MNTNVCGKVAEGAGPTADPVYIPLYMLESPDRFQRMVLPSLDTYQAGGPPMCPNDPNTLERECQYLVRLARYLKERDTTRTVIMAQINNEIGYCSYLGYWEGKAPDIKTYRCQCAYCDKKWNGGAYVDYPTFMNESLADYIKVLSDAFTDVYPLPLYINDACDGPTFLDRCPNIALMGIDALEDPQEPNYLSDLQFTRNISFASECPTEGRRTKFNADVLPYYLIIGQLGLGHLFWEAPEPHTIVYDPDAARRYGQAAYPIKHAMFVIGRYRGTPRLSGWHELRNFDTKLPTSIFVREGAQTRILDYPADLRGMFYVRIGNAILSVTGSSAGIVAELEAGDLIIATPAAHIAIRGMNIKSAETGKFVGDRWIGESSQPLGRENGVVVLDVVAPSVVRLHGALA